MLRRLAFISLSAVTLWAQSRAACPIHMTLPGIGSQRTYAGEYRNGSYGFSVVIPHGLTGVDADNPAYQKGFIIALKDPERTVSVFADTNSLEYPDAKAAAAGELGLFQQGLRVENQQIRGTELGGKPAATLSFQYRCSNQESRYVHVEVIAISPDGQYVYTIAWDGAADQDRLGQRIIIGLKRSWRYLSAK